MLLSNVVVSRVSVRPTNYPKESKEKCGIEQSDARGVGECTAVMGSRPYGGFLLLIFTYF